MGEKVQTRSMVGFLGLLIVNFTAMFLIAGVGVYSYTVASVFDGMDSVSMIFALECAARSVTIPLGGKLGDKIGHKRLFLGALALYIASYAVCSVSTSFWMFVIARMCSGFAFMGLAGAVGSTVSGGICGALLNGAGGFSAVFTMPIICAAVMLAFALMFKDAKAEA